MVELDGATAIVSGASAGIGGATARKLASDGANVALLARREERLRDLAEEIEAEHGVEAVTIPTNVRDDEAVDRAVERTVDSFGGIDILVNNAGLARGDDIETMSTEQYRAMQETNTDGSFYLTRAALPHLREASGNLIFVGSFAGEFPRSANPVYAATKWWLRGFAHSVAAQVGEDVGITVVNPTEVRTEFGSEEGDAFEEQFDPGEVTEPEEVADAIAFAASRTNSTVQELDLYRRNKFATTSF